MSFPAAQAYAATTIFFWSAAYVCTRIGVQHYSVTSISFLRCTIAALVLLPILLGKRRFSWKMLAYCLFPAFLGFTGYLPLFGKGLQTIDSATSCVVISLSPVITAILSSLFLKQYLPRKAWGSIGISFAGVCVLLCWNGINLNIGVLWTLVGAVLLSAYNVTTSVLSKKYAPLDVTVCSFLLAAIMLLPSAPYALQELSSANTTQIINILVLGLGSSAIAYLVWAKALTLAKRVSEVTNWMFVTPFGAGILAAIVAGEVPRIETFIGGALILLGLILFRKSID